MIIRLNLPIHDFYIIVNGLSQFFQSIGTIDATSIVLDQNYNYLSLNNG